MGMSEATKIKFASQADGQLLAEMRRLAAEEGRQLQALLDEAMRDLLAKRQQAHSRPDVMAALARSKSKFDGLYRELAK